MNTLVYTRWLAAGWLAVWLVPAGLGFLDVRWDQVSTAHANSASECFVARVT